MRVLGALALLLAGTASALAAPWSVDPAQSEIAFSGTHAGRTFKGVFQSWAATIDFDPDAPETGKVEVVVDLSTARTGDGTYDRTLPQKDWLDTTASSKATFASNAIRKGDTAGQYVADGTLTIRGKTQPVTLPFTLTTDGDKARMSGRTVLKRLDYGIGQSSDGNGGFVSLEIPVDVKVAATKR
jgi:polyisoprenoid-binding protein YceI